MGHFVDIDNLDIGQLALDLLNATLGKTLLFTGGVILGVLFQITVFTGRGNIIDNRRPYHFGEMLKLFPQSNLTLNSHWGLLHYTISWCRDWMRRTVVAPWKFNA